MGEESEVVVKGRRMGTERFQGDRGESVCNIAMENREESSTQRQGQDGQQRPLLAESVRLHRATVRVSATRRSN